MPQKAEAVGWCPAAEEQHPPGEAGWPRAPSHGALPSCPWTVFWMQFVGLKGIASILKHELWSDKLLQSSDAQQTFNLQVHSRWRGEAGFPKEGDRAKEMCAWLH